MTPKEKADELIIKFSEHIMTIYELEGWVEHVDSSKAKGHALTAVDEILNHHHQSQGLYRIDRYFWEQVKKEIQSI